MAQVPHPTGSGGLSPNGLHTPVIFSLAGSRESASGAPTLLEMEAAAAAPHTERVSLVPSLSEAPCSLPH